LLACVAIAAGAAIAQPVAKLEVVSSKSPSQHERIEQKLDRILEILKGGVPPSKPPVPPEPPPAKPPEQPPATPDGPNLFADWCAQGNTVVQYVMLRNGGIGLSPAQIEQARAAGCFGVPATAAGPATPTGVDPGGFDLGAGGGTVLRHEVAAGQAVTFTFEIVAGKEPQLAVFGIAGTRFRRFTDWGPGFAARVTEPIDGRHMPLAGLNLAPGRYSYTVAVEPGGSLGITLP
jgi:hypothetical protein